MASFSPPSANNLTFSTSKFPSSSSSSSLSSFPKRSSCPSPSPQFPSHTNFTCHCQNSDSSSSTPWRWDSALQGLLKSAIERFDSYINPRSNNASKDARNRSDLSGREDVGDSVKDDEDDRDWDWDRWRKHFDEVDEQERLVAVLKSRLRNAVYAEDYEDASRLKVAIAAIVRNDAVGRVMSHLNTAIAEERYQDATFMRDIAGAGLVGWWTGISKDKNNPRGLVVRITAEHGRYLARSYSPRQLATAAPGVPLFEIFLIVDDKGEYKQKAVYLKQRGVFQDPPFVSSKISDTPGILNPLDPAGDKDNLFVIGSEDAEDGDGKNDDSDVSLGAHISRNMLSDMIPGVKFKVLKVTVPGKVDKDLISKVIEQIIEEEEEGEEEEDEEEENDSDLESMEVRNEIKGADQERVEVHFADSGIIESEGQNEIAVKVVVGGLVQKLSGGVPAKDLLRVPAMIEKNGRFSFSFTIEKEDNVQESQGEVRASLDKKTKHQGQSGIDSVMLDLAKFVGREKIPMKVLKDLGELINLSLKQAQNYQPLSGSTTFNRIQAPGSSDPLTGLYVGAHGLYSSEIIHLRRRFGQWKEDGKNKESSDIEFFEYVEALKITGDPYVPAGQVAFRAKVGKRDQLPHRGIIPEEFGVIARYKGQGRLAEPGFRNPQWVDGELVILDGKYIKGGPVVGFVYWAPEFHFLVFFNRLRLQE